MTSFADLGLALALAAITGAAAAAPAGAADAAWNARVATAIAARWGVPAETVALDWGRVPEAGLPAPDTAFRLLGGAGGWFVLASEGGASAVASVRVRAGVTDTVCVATRDLARGAHLEASDLRREPRVLWGTPRAGRDAVAPGAGWELRRAVAAGTVVDRPTAEPPAAVHAGDRIDVWWRHGDVALRLSGVALHGARLGEPVRVRVDGRPRPLTGVVDAPGRAVIGAREAS